MNIRREAFRYNDRGDYYFDRHDIKKAKLSYIRYCKLNYDDKETSALVYCNLAVCLYYQKQYQKAILHYQTSLLYDPNLHYAYNGWGSSLSNMGKFDEAIEKFQQALEIRPKYPLSRMNIVLALFLKKNDEEALKFFEKIKEDSDFNFFKENMRIRYEKEIEMLDLRISEAIDQDEIELIQERKKGVELLLILLSDKEEDSEEISGHLE